ACWAAPVSTRSPTVLPSATSAGYPRTSRPPGPVEETERGICSISGQSVSPSISVMHGEVIAPQGPPPEASPEAPPPRPAGPAPPPSAPRPRCPRPRCPPRPTAEPAPPAPDAP